MAWYSVTGWSPRSESAALRRYYAELISPILSARGKHGSGPAIDAAMHYLLDKLIWGVTTLTDGPQNARWDTRYISSAVRDLYEELTIAAARRELSKASARIIPLLRHEHVVPRKFLRERLVAGDLEWTLKNATACVVTKLEHDRLPDSPAGWERYRRAGIPVWDRSGAGAWLEW